MGSTLRMAPVGALVALGMVLTASGPAFGQSGRAAGAAAQVTDDLNPVRGHSTPQIARNPTNGELVIVESDPRSNARKCAVHLSTNNGRTWAPGGDPHVKPYTDCSFYAEYGSYASLAFGRNGTLYVAFVASEPLARTRNEVPRHVFLARSTDSGRSFETAATVFKAPEGNQDRGLNKGPMVAVDPVRPERVYVGWRQGIFANNATEKLKSNIAASSDGGRTFGPPVDLTDDRGGDYPAIAVSRDGAVHAVYWTRTGVASAPPPPTPPVRPLQYAVSTDQGKTFARAREIDPGNQRADRPPQLAADPKGRALYMVWYGHSEPNNMAQGFRGDLEILFRASQDGGATWGDRTVLNDDGNAKVHQSDPGISVAPNGRIDIAWYDARLSPRAPDLGSINERGFQDVYYTWSADQGRTFSPNTRVTDRSIDRSIGVWSNNVDSHYNVGVASTDSTVYFAWQDSRNGNAETNAEDIYTTSLDHVVPAVTENSSRFNWGLLVLGVALGLGAGMGAAILVSHRSARPAAARQPIE